MDAAQQYRVVQEFGDRLLARVETMPMAHRFASQWMVRGVLDELAEWQQKAQQWEKAKRDANPI